MKRLIYLIIFIIPLFVKAQNRWIYNNKNDEMTGVALHTASNLSLNSFKFGFPYNRCASMLKLNIRKRGNNNTIFLELTQGQILDNKDALIKIDNEAPIRIYLSYPTDNSRNVVFITGGYKSEDKYEEYSVTDIIKKIALSKSIKFQFVVYQNGSPIFRFNTSNFKHKDFVNIPTKEEIKKEKEEIEQKNKDNIALFSNAMLYLKNKNHIIYNEDNFKIEQKDIGFEISLDITMPKNITKDVYESIDSFLVNSLNAQIIHGTGATIIFGYSEYNLNKKTVRFTVTSLNDNINIKATFI